MSMNGGAVSFVYDGDGNRVAKSVNGTITRYLVDDLNPTGYSQVVEELNGAGAATRTYTYGLQRVGEYQYVAGNNAWTPSFYQYDGMGNVPALADSTGKVTDTYEYDAFGNALVTTGTTPNVYLYRGEQYDSDLGLYYLRARYYNPLTGRFLSRDPLDGDEGDPESLHKYIYAGADSVNFSDPTGQGRVGLGRGSALREYGALIGVLAIATVWELHNIQYDMQTHFWDNISQWLGSIKGDVK